MKIIAVEPMGMSAAQMAYYEKQFARMGHQFIGFPDRKEDRETLMHRMRYADVAIVSNIRLDSSILSECAHLKLLAIAFSGIDHVDTAYCEEQGIAVCNAAGYARVAVAELTLGLIISLYRQIPFFDTAIRQGGGRGTFAGRQLHGKTVGIVGIGGIGKVVAENLQSLGCVVVAWDRSEDPDVKAKGIRYLPLETLLASSDIVSLHLPLSKESEGILSADRIRLMRPDAILINTARGKLVDLRALAQSLREGRLAGAAFDVFEIEPPLPPSHPLLNAPHCIVTPHIGYATQEAFDLRVKIIMEKIHEWLRALPS